MNVERNGAVLEGTRAWRVWVWCWSALLATGLSGGATGAEAPGAGEAGAKGARPPAPLYEQRAEHARDGIGKFFLGREIAHYMSHLGADWLEREEREDEERPARLLEALKLEPGMVVADIGAGSGYITRRMAQKVTARGRVYANDIQPEMLAILRTNVARAGLSNVVAVLGTEMDPRLPARSLDLAILVDVYHEFAFPYEMTGKIVEALKPGGRLVFVEYRGEEKWVPIKPLHKMTEAQVKREMELHPLEWVETSRVLPRQHIIVFRRRFEKPQP